MRALVFLACALPLAAQEQTDLLARVKARVGDTVTHLSQLMCTQTVERTNYELASIFDRAVACADIVASKKPLRETTSDRLRLDVGTSDKGEIYSWAGENRFHDRNVTEIVREGAISNGPFSSFLRIIFFGDRAEFSAAEEANERGRRLAVFHFHVPREASHYVFSNKARVTTAYEGDVLVDPLTADIVRLTVRTADLPLETGACRAATTLDYRRVRINETDFLLPASTRMEIVNADGSRRENHTEFSNCHQFLGESKLTFGPPAEDTGSAPATGKPSAGPPVIPDGLPFETAIETPIDTRKAAVGDALTARLTFPIRQGSHIIVPAKTLVTARIVEMRHFQRILVSLRFKLESITINGVRYPFAAQPDLNAQRTVASRAGSLMRRDPIANARVFQDEGSVAILFQDPRHDLVIRSGLQLSWRTGEPGAPGPQSSPTDTLSAALTKLQPTIHKLPQYMCTQTIERRQFAPAGPTPAYHSCDDVLARKEKLREVTSDRLRLDVAFGGEREMFSWAGEQRFDEHSLEDVVAGGAFSTGTFASMLKMIFDSDNAEISYAGDIKTGSRTLSQYRFRVPQERSHFWFGGRNGAMTSYSGTFDIDTTTLELVDVAMRSGQLPPLTGACESTETLSYMQAAIGGAAVAIPDRATLRVVNRDGTETESVSTFAACREFAGHSTLRFDVAATVRDEVAAETPKREMPVGLHFGVAFDRDLDTSLIAGGDAVAAHLTTDLPGMPAGSKVTIRLLRVRRYLVPEKALRVELELEDLTAEQVNKTDTAINGPKTIVFPKSELPRRGAAALFFEDVKVIPKSYVVEFVTYVP